MCSMWSGKADVYDSIGEEITDFNNVKIYASGNNLIPLRIDCEKDLVPYYPYLTACMSSSVEDGVRKYNIHLSRRSFVDSEEDERKEWYLNSALRLWRRCRRNKTKFEAKVELAKLSFASNMETEIYKIVEEKGDKVKLEDLEDIHDSLHDHYRQELYKKMLEVGYEKNRAYAWCFGWKRLCEKNKEEA